MGSRDLPDTLKSSPSRRCFPADVWLRCLGALVLLPLLLLGSSLCAQGALSRDFEQAFLARREAEIDRAFAKAKKQRQQDALLPLQRAIDIRSTPVLNGERSKLLAEAMAVLCGLEYEKDAKGEIVFKDKQRYADFCWRFNFWMLALPEVVDPLKSKLDEDRVIEIFQGSMPRLGTVMGPPQRLKANRIHLTARGVFGLPKPKKFSLRMGIRRPRGPALATSVLDDSKDPGGWRVFDLTKSFPVNGYGAGYYEAFAEINIEGRKRSFLDPVLQGRFAIRPGFYRDLWTLFSWRKRLSERREKANQDGKAGQDGSGKDAEKDSVRPCDLSRLDALTMELYRVFVLGKEYGFRPWTLESLDEALKLVETLLARKQPVLPKVGDQIYGVRLEDGKSLPVRIIHGKSLESGKRRATIWFAPLFWDKDWAVDGLGLPSSLFQQEGRVHVFLYHQPQKGYLEGIQDLLKLEFGVEPDRLRVVGVQAGVTRARFALPLLEKPPQEFVWVGSSTIPLEVLSGQTPVRLFPALGLPTDELLQKARKRIEKIEKGGSTFEVRGSALRSLGTAVRDLLNGD